LLSSVSASALAVSPFLRKGNARYGDARSIATAPLARLDDTARTEKGRTIVNTNLGIILSICAPVLTALFGILAARIWTWAGAHFSATELATAQGAAAVAVKATEQIAANLQKSTLQQWTSDQKYTAATNMLTDLLAKAHISLSADQVKPLIEGAVQELNAAQSAPQAPPPAVAQNVGNVAVPR
jgi:hypothetical protein